jgi:Mg2+-importing ATPase
MARRIVVPRSRATHQLHGPNVIVTDTNSHVIVKLVRRFLQPLVLVLLVASVISGLSGDLASSMIILIIVGVSTGLDVVQEQGAERAAAALRQSIAIWVEALRDGEPADIPVEQLVPGDVVRLGPGDLVPADGLVLMSHGGRVNEALLTGEPYPVDKRPGPSGANDPSAAFDALFGGTAVVSGELLMLVAATGPATTLGAVAASCNPMPRPPLLKGAPPARPRHCQADHRARALCPSRPYRVSPPPA